ncbi:hypothetical protein L914_08669 [Phytophthora nicotianae]|uniref:Uncharacterized protein n=1 Tax=Phytophthora nicotianae TaxID=4792 RepID=W2NCQ1_PHYNI|nr:hypothetical protein L914_08669 [Phytophthora nicotianae]
MFDAALPADVSSLEQLLARYKSGVSKPLVAAPARGHKDVVPAIAAGHRLVTLLLRRTELGVDSAPILSSGMKYTQQLEVS